jgi:hypothetical protein
MKISKQICVSSFVLFGLVIGLAGCVAEVGGRGGGPWYHDGPWMDGGRWGGGPRVGVGINIHPPGFRR